MGLEPIQDLDFVLPRFMPIGPEHEGVCWKFHIYCDLPLVVYLRHLSCLIFFLFFFNNELPHVGFEEVDLVSHR